MKNSPLVTVLLALLTCATLGALILCGVYIHTTRELRTLQTGVAIINQKQTYMKFLAEDLVEYSKRNQAIDPILESAGIKLKTGSTNNGAAKAGSK
jgi:hypothetical protein